MKIPRHKFENNIINSVFDSGSNNIITKKICPKGPKLCSAKCMASLHLSFIDLEARGIRRNITLSVDISLGDDILYRKLKTSKLRIKNLTHTFVNTMFYFRINASIVAFESHIVWNINDNIFQNLLQNFEKAPAFTSFTRIIHHSSILFIFCRPCCCHACCLAWSTRIMFHPMFPGEHGVEHCQKERRLAN